MKRLNNRNWVTLKRDQRLEYWVRPSVGSGGSRVCGVCVYWGLPWGCWDWGGGCGLGWPCVVNLVVKLKFIMAYISCLWFLGYASRWTTLPYEVVNWSKWSPQFCKIMDQSLIGCFFEASFHFVVLLVLSVMFPVRAVVLLLSKLVLSIKATIPFRQSSGLVFGSVRAATTNNM